MACFFFDSSAVVKRYVQETGSAWVRSITDPPGVNDLVLARITGVEVMSALVRHVPPLAPPDLATALAYFRVHFAKRFRLVAIDRGLIQQAMTLAVLHQLRAYDAVQLAAARRARIDNLANGLPAPVFVSADVALNAAATAEGFTVEDPNTHP